MKTEHSRSYVTLFTTIDGGKRSFFSPKNDFEIASTASYVDESLSGHLADVVFEVPYRDSREDSAKIVMIFEHKSYKDEKLPYQ